MGTTKPYRALTVQQHNNQDPNWAVNKKLLGFWDGKLFIVIKVIIEWSTTSNNWKNGADPKQLELRQITL